MISIHCIFQWFRELISETVYQLTLSGQLFRIFFKIGIIRATDFGDGLFLGMFGTIDLGDCLLTGIIRTIERGDTPLIGIVRTIDDVGDHCLNTLRYNLYYVTTRRAPMAYVRTQYIVHGAAPGCRRLEHTHTKEAQCLSSKLHTHKPPRSEPYLVVTLRPHIYTDNILSSKPGSYLFIISDCL